MLNSFLEGFWAFVLWHSVLCEFLRGEWIYKGLKNPETQDKLIYNKYAIVPVFIDFLGILYFYLLRFFQINDWTHCFDSKGTFSERCWEVEEKHWTYTLKT